MKTLDYIVVGCGLAGISFCNILKQNKKTVIVVDNAKKESSSMVAGGLYNPLVLKRFTKAWNAEQQLSVALPVYAQLEQDLNITLDYKTPVYRLFASVEEQNNWFEASDNPNLAAYLSPKIIKDVHPHIQNNFGFGKVINTGRIDTALLVKAYKKHLSNSNTLLQEEFDYNSLQIQKTYVTYKNYNAKQIIFAEGFGLKQNPFFNYLPLDGTKGELLTLHIPDLDISCVLKSSVFLIPLGNHYYRLGATYDWKDKTTQPTLAGKDALLQKLNRFLTCKFTVVNHFASIRPTVNDRRPLVGAHPKYHNVYALNGLGTRGVMIGPYVAQKLYDAIEHKTPLDNAIAISRYNKLLFP